MEEGTEEKEKEKEMTFDSYQDDPGPSELVENVLGALESTITPERMNDAIVELIEIWEYRGGDPQEYDVYLAGGIFGLDDVACKGWREEAKQLLGDMIIADPMVRDYRGQEDTNYKRIVGSDLRDINNSRYMLVNASKPSWGTAMEIVYARQLGLTIVAFTDGRVSPWLRYHCNKVYNTLADATAFLKGEK